MNWEKFCNILLQNNFFDNNVYVITDIKTIIQINRLMTKISTNEMYTCDVRLYPSPSGIVKTDNNTWEMLSRQILEMEKLWQYDMVKLCIN